MYSPSRGHAKFASLLADKEFFLHKTDFGFGLALAPPRIFPEGPKPVELHFLGAFLGAAKF